ncbi:hypothetical protein [Fimbriimonas ginsengisoli]|uniref:Uncharacterized protein n=1 Tax=Fimbriimonas ginsengisoli Gsoil 348 TaxID=661478 RepID=A0A068NRH5_FIMGI|nr:hypothetical protein [Fimbriimonas ginsengisoli]AIE86031.1 hypothetical protein OP10G_2663 [Fimbriimonas ginsengisoli Gsoil 348]
MSSTVAAVFLTATLAVGQSDTGPRHFIVLVDASRSMHHGTAEDAVRRRNASRDAMEGEVFAHLARHGFPAAKGRPTVPPYRKGVDYVSLIRYGVVTNSKASPNQNELAAQLRRSKLPHDFIHADVRLSLKFDPFRLRASLPYVGNSDLAPYWYGPQSWARTYGLLEARAGKAREIQRTYLLLISDDQVNDSTLSTEAVTLDRLVRETNEDPAAKRRRFADRYRLTDGTGSDGVIYEQAYPTKGDPVVWASLQEVVARERSALEQKGESLLPFKSAAARWFSSKSDRPEAEVAFRLAPEFTSWLASADSFEGSVEVEAGDRRQTLPLDLDRPFDHVRLQFPNRPPWGFLGDLRLTVSVSRSDPQLGMRRTTYQFTPQQFDLAQLPEVPATENPWIWGLGVVILTLGTWWSTRRIVEAWQVQVLLDQYPNQPVLLPHLAKQGFSATEHVWLPPEPNTVALTVLLPNRIVRQLVNRNARLSLECSSGATMKWRIDGDEEVPLLRRVKGRTICAVWEQTSENPTTANLTCRSGPLSSGLQVVFTANA